jgi:hypothetical protein
LAFILKMLEMLGRLMRCLIQHRLPVYGLHHRSRTLAVEATRFLRLGLLEAVAHNIGGTLKEIKLFLKNHFRQNLHFIRGGSRHLQFAVERKGKAD